MTLGTVTQVSPLLVRVDDSTVPTDARLIVGSSLVLAVGGRVVLARIGSRLYVLGGA